MFIIFICRLKSKDPCPLELVRVNLEDDITHFTETILEKSTNKKGFFKTSLAGFTFQTVNSTFVDIRTWFSNQVLSLSFECSSLMAKFLGTRVTKKAPC